MSLGLGQEIYVMSLKHLVAPESKEVSANKTKQIKQTNRKKKDNHRDLSKKHKNQLKELSMAKTGTI